MISLLAYLGVGIITFLGLYLGMLLTFIAPEELEPGRRYLKLLSFVMVSLFLSIMHYALFNLIILSSALFVIQILLLIKLSKRFENLVNSFYLLSFFSLGYFSTTPYFILVACVIFITGFPIGSLLVQEPYNKKTRLAEVKAVFKRYWIILFCILVSYFIFYL